jgi:hypothetical protein
MSIEGDMQMYNTSSAVPFRTASRLWMLFAARENIACLKTGTFAWTVSQNLSIYVF